MVKNMLKLTIRAAIEALTVADDKELINELENRAKLQLYTNTYLCHICYTAPRQQNNICSKIYAFRAISRKNLIDQISKCEVLFEQIAWWFEMQPTDDNFSINEKYYYRENWYSLTFDEAAKGDEEAQKIIYTIIERAIESDDFQVRALEEAMVEPDY